MNRYKMQLHFSAAYSGKKKVYCIVIKCEWNFVHVLNMGQQKTECRAIFQSLQNKTTNMCLI